MTRAEHETLTGLLDDLREAREELTFENYAASVKLSHCIARLATVLDDAAAPCIRCSDTEPPITERSGVLTGDGFEVHAAKPARDA